MSIDPRYNPAGDCQEAPDTSVTHEAIVDGRTGIEHEIAEWVEMEEPGFCGGFISANMLKNKLKANGMEKFAGYLKLKETLTRLGYEIHRGMKDGRAQTIIMPDNTRPVLWVKADSPAAEYKGAAIVGHYYTTAQQAAATAAITRMFGTV